MDREPTSPASTTPLSQIAHARSGDKGNHANIGVIAYTPSGFEYLRRELTVDVVARHFAGLSPSRVERYELPRIRALNFVLYDVLAGGASRSLRIDTQGKLLGTALLKLALPRPPDLDTMLRGSEAERAASSDAGILPADAPNRTAARRERASMNAGLVRISVHEHTGTVILNRPPKRNALSRALLAELREALVGLHRQKAVRAVVLTGAGPAFCAGMDLDEMLATTTQPDATAQWQADASDYHELVETLLRFPKPLIAAVNGPAVGGGAGLALACDVVIAAESAKFALPEPRRGIVAGMVAPLVYFRVGAGHAARILLTACTLDATEAHRLGLFHEVVPADHLWPRAHELAGECAKSAPQALLQTKRMLNETIGEHLFTWLSAGAAASAAARTTDAAREGLAAFAEKREPKWE